MRDVTLSNDFSCFPYILVTTSCNRNLKMQQTTHHCDTTCCLKLLALFDKTRTTSRPSSLSDTLNSSPIFGFGLSFCCLPPFPADRGADLTFLDTDCRFALAAAETERLCSFLSFFLHDFACFEMSTSGTLAVHNRHGSATAPKHSLSCTKPDQTQPQITDNSHLPAARSSEFKLAMTQWFERLLHQRCFIEGRTTPIFRTNGNSHEQKSKQ